MGNHHMRKALLQQSLVMNGQIQELWPPALSRQSKNHLAAGHVHQTLHDGPGLQSSVRCLYTLDVDRCRGVFIFTQLPFVHTVCCEQRDKW